MQWYFRAIMSMGIFSMLSGAIVQLRLFQSMSPTTMITALAVVSLFMTTLNYMLRQEQVVRWVLENKYLIIKTELCCGLTIATAMVYFGVDNTTLVVRWILAQTVMDGLNAMFKFLFEKVKEERGDGSYVSATMDMHKTFGFLIGHVVAIVAINMWPNMNQDWLIYSHGFIMSLGSLGLLAALREHDRRSAV